MHPEIARAWSVLQIRGVCNVLFAFVAFLPSRLTLHLRQHTLARGTHSGVTLGR
jgi:hypothetical protein